MFNRTNKLAAGLLAAAAMVSVVPANAAERLANMDGNITSAIAFDGGYVFEGYKTDDDDTSLYYNNGSKDSEVENCDDYSYSEMKKYGEKFALVTDDGEDYLLDLSKGEISEDESLDDKLINLASKLRTNLKKTDRYGKITDSELDKDDLKQVLDGRFGEVWYQYAVRPLHTADGIKDAIKPLEVEALTENENEDKVLFGLTNESGKYIDLSEVANITVVKADGKSVKVAEFNEDKDGVTVALTKAPVVLAQDKDNFYVQIEVKITGAKATEATYIQKVSKAQGEKVDGAYAPKSVSSYEIANGVYNDEEDIDKAATLIGAAKSINVKNGNLLVTTTTVSGTKKKVTVSVIKLKKEKPELTINGSKKDVDVYVAKFDKDDEQDMIEGDSYTIDAEGNTWALDKGKIYKFDGSEFQQVYTCDRSINTLDVYDENNLIAWDSKGDVFTAVNSGVKVDEEETKKDEEETKKDEETTTVTKAGWDKNADGTWSYYRDNAAVKGQWVEAGNWYYLDANGIMATGWLNDRGTWYYLNASGAMQTGWLNDNGTWYYLNASGAMLSNTTVDGYVLGANGAWVR